MKVSVVIASHQRNQALRIVLNCLPRDWHATVVVSDEAEAYAVMDWERPHTYVHMHPNQPVGAKWQAAVDWARKGDPDLLVITGSDDVLLGDTAQLAATMATCDSIGLRQWLAYDGTQHYEMRYREHVAIPLGAGRVYTRAILDRMGWRVFDTTRNRGLDNLGYHAVIAAGGTCPIVDAIPGLQVVSIKGPWECYNPMDRLRYSPHVQARPLGQRPFLANYDFTRLLAQA